MHTLHKDTNENWKSEKLAFNFQEILALSNGPRPKAQYPIHISYGTHKKRVTRINAISKLTSYSNLSIKLLEGNI